jgi:hypothetical protein
VKPANRKKLSFSRDLISLKRRSVPAAALQAIKLFGLEVPCQLSRNQFWPREDAGGLRDYFRIAANTSTVMPRAGNPNVFLFDRKRFFPGF